MLTNDWRLGAHLPNSISVTLTARSSFVVCLRFTLRIVCFLRTMSQNPIWDFFVKGQQDASKAKCVTCGKDYSLGSDKPKLQTVTGLKSHLAKHHKEINAEYQKRAGERIKENATKKLKLDESVAVSEPNLAQLSIPQFKERKAAYPDDVVQRIDKVIMDMIIVDMLPYSAVEGEAFKRLNFADPNGPRRFEAKSEKYYRTTLMPATYDKVANQVKKLLTEAQWISFTTDAWSNATKSCSLLSFTGHFVHESVRRKVVLGAMVLEDDHTGAYLASKLKEAITRWGIESKIHVGVRDNAANMVAALRIAAVVDIGCVAHTLQLVLHDALFMQSSVESVVKKARKIVSHFKHSEQACRHLAECQKSCDIPEHKLIQDVETRWNSTYLMLQRVAEQRKALNLYSVERGSITTLTNPEWELAERVVLLLKPFYEATLEICSDDACISIVIPLIAMLTGKLQSTTEDHGLLQMKAALRDALGRRFAYVKESSPMTAATMLDPRFKDVYFNVQEKEAAKEEILNFLRSTVDDSDTPTETGVRADDRATSSSSSDNVATSSTAGQSY